MLNKRAFQFLIDVVSLLVIDSSISGDHTMKAIFTILACAVGAAFGDMHADGSGFFPVVVQVVEEESGTPIAGAIVRMDDLPPYRELELNSDRQTKVLPVELGKEVVTNAMGVAVVFYFGRWGSFSSAKESTYSRALVGTVVVEHMGKKIFRKSLKDWAKETKFDAGACSAPWIVVPIPKTGKKAEQKGADGKPTKKAPSP